MFNKIIKAHKAALEEQIRLIEDAIKERELCLKNLNSEINNKTQSLKQIENNLTETKARWQKCKQELSAVEGIITMEDMGLIYEPASNDLDMIAYKKAQAQEKIGALIGNDKVIITTRIYRIDNSETKGKQFQKTFCENLLIGFNAYYNQKRKAITVTNINKSKELITKKFNAINKKAALMGISINQEYLNLCLELLGIELDQKISKAEERERIKEERRRLREQERLLAEAEKERKRLEEERHNLQKLFAKAITEQEQEDIKNKLAEVDKRTEEIDWRISHQSAGWLYIATTPCLEGMYKAGCTKQLNPLNRLAQLSSASVPYPFVCHGLVFSEDVFDLEAKLHKRLDSVRVNKMNRGKEFFYGSPEEAIKILKEEFKVDVHFIDENWVEEE